MSWTHDRSRVAILSRHHNENCALVEEARVNLKASRLEDHVARVVASAPPLTQEQRDRIASLLRGAA